MAPLEQYLIPNRADEIAQALHAAPASIANDADVMVLGRGGYETVVKGRNSFVCLVQRSWFSVNLFSDSISQLKPPDRLTLPPTRAVAVQATHRGQLEIWPWIALAALAIVTAEWLAFHRGL